MLPDDIFNKVTESIDKISKEETFGDVLKNACKVIKLSNKENIGCIIMAGMLFIILSCFVINKDGIPKIIESTNTLLIALLAIVVTGYSIFQAMLSAETLITFLSTNENEHKICWFRYSQYIFFGLCIFYIVMIFINYSMLFVMSACPVVMDGFCTYHQLLLDILLSVYFFIEMSSMFILKSFIYNLYQVFTFSCLAKILERLKKDK